jgi:hypothetical protein
MSFTTVLTLVILTQTALDHFANDLLSEGESNLPLYSERQFTKPTLTFNIKGQVGKAIC